jgi:hypothetical protein
MWRNPKAQNWRFPQVVGLLALVWMEFNVLCNPFSPIEILRWVESSDRRCETSTCLGTGVAETSIERKAVTGTTNLPNGRPDQSKAPVRLKSSPEIDDVIAIPPRLRLVGFRLPTLDFSLPAPVPEFLSNSANPDETQVADRLSIQKQLGRLRC